MELTLIRHGRPERVENAAGPADPALTELGHRQAAAAAGWLTDGQPAFRFDALYVSPMLRARQTAAPIEAAFSMTAVVDAGVQEYDAAENHYIPMEEVRANKEQWRRFVADQQKRNMGDFHDLVVSSLEAIIAAHRGQSVAVVCHGGVINMWAAKVLGLEARMFFEPDYTSVNRFIAASSGERSITSLNETAHLRQLG